MALVPFAISLVFYSRLPEQVPTHWNGAGEVNGYSSRLMACFGTVSYTHLDVYKRQPYLHAHGGRAV